jgi:hypothetical protein
MFQSFSICMFDGLSSCFADGSINQIQWKTPWFWMAIRDF